MRSTNRLVSLGFGVAALLTLAATARAQNPTPAPAPAPAAAPAAVDTNALWAGDWDYQINWRDSTIEGTMRIVYSGGRFTGTVTRSGVPPAPVRSFSLSKNKRDMNLSVDWNGQEVRFSGHMENPRSITGQASMTGGFGRLIVRKRSD